jgi:MATE family multidrug resistance protein
MSSSAASQPGPAGAWGAEFRAMLSLAWPLVMTNLSQIALATTDVIMMGWIGPDALAAGALGVNLNFAFLIFGIGLVTATAPLMAIELGRRRHSVREVRRTVRQGFWTALVFTIPVWFVLWHGESLLLLLGQKPDLAKSAAGYLHTFQWSFLPALWFIVLRNFVSALERPLIALWIGGAAIAVNASLVYVLMFGKLGLPALGLPGAGIATTVTNAFMVAGMALLISLDRRFRRYRLFAGFWRVDGPRFFEICRIGLPIAVTFGFEVTIFNASVFLMGLIGTDALAAHSIATQIGSIAFMVPMGLGNAATLRVGLALGAGDAAAVGRAGWSAFATAMAYACCAASLMMLCGRALVGLFIDTTAPANTVVVNLAVSYVFLAGVFQLVDSAQATANGMLRGLGDTRVPMALAGVGYWLIGMPLAVVLAFWLGLEGRGIWMGLAAGLTVVAVLMTYRWSRRDRLGLSHLGETPAGAPVVAGTPLV